MNDLRTLISYNAVDVGRIRQVLDSYQGKHHNHIISDFEADLRKKTGAPYVLALNSGTSAIHLALRLLNISDGDEVLTSTFTYVATVNPILYERATPVFVDSEGDSWNMDPDLLEIAINDRLAKGKLPKAILVVHCYGVPARLLEIVRIGEKYGIPVIEDAAEALGSAIGDRHPGTFGVVGILSFNNNKIVTTYGGGALLCRSEADYKKAQLWANQARESLPYYEHRELGFNYRMGPLNAACGISQLSDLEGRVKSRQTIFNYYSKSLSRLSITFPKEPNGSSSNCWISAVLFRDREIRSETEKRLLANGIEVRPVWNPMHKQPLLKSFPVYGGAVSEDLFSRGMCLPSHVTEEVVNKVVECIRSVAAL